MGYRVQIVMGEWILGDGEGEKCVDVGGDRPA